MPSVKDVAALKQRVATNRNQPQQAPLDLIDLSSIPVNVQALADRVNQLETQKTELITMVSDILDMSDSLISRVDKLEQTLKKK